jgi:mycobactin lysine-N-oxygenase
MTNSHPQVLAVVGAGPKAMALVTKAKVLRDLKIGTLEVVIIEKSSTAAHWGGACGYTDGEQELGTPPEKDVGFPYRSIFGRKTGCEMLRYSWQSFLIDKGQSVYSDWIDRGRRQPVHRDWAEYLHWVRDEADAEIIQDTVVSVDLREQGQLGVNLLQGKPITCHGLVFTGPGRARTISDEQSDAEHIFDGRSYWQNLDRFRALTAKADARVAVVGAGETAASVVSSLLNIFEDTTVTIDSITRSGTLFTRGESFHENRIFSNPDEWAGLRKSDKEEFIERTDKGVFSVAAQAIIKHAWGNFRVSHGNVESVRVEGEKVSVRISGRKYKTPLVYDKVVVATGFDPWEPLKTLFSTETWGNQPLMRLKDKIDYHLRFPVGAKKVPGHNIHTPMLAGLAQGPGFPNLSCLGVLSDRIISTYIAPPKS